jgi:hypothetical protein
MKQLFDFNYGMEEGEKFVVELMPGYQVEFDNKMDAAAIYEALGEDFTEKVDVPPEDEIAAMELNDWTLKDNELCSPT